MNNLNLKNITEQLIDSFLEAGKIAKEISQQGFKISIKSDKNYHVDIGSMVMANISANLCLLFDNETGQMLDN